MGLMGRDSLKKVPGIGSVDKEYRGQRSGAYRTFGARWGGSNCQAEERSKRERSVSRMGNERPGRVEREAWGLAEGRPNYVNIIDSFSGYDPIVFFG